MQIRKLQLILFIVLISCFGCQKQKAKKTLILPIHHQVKMKCQKFTCRYVSFE